LTTVHAAMLREHPDAFSPNANAQLIVRPLRDQITRRHGRFCSAARLCGRRLHHRVLGMSRT
jgi:hypothetical protein